MCKKQFATLLTGILALLLLCSAIGLAEDDGAGDDAVKLYERGVKLFKQMKYKQATAVLREARKANLAQDRLSEQQKKELDRLLDESVVAARRYDLAKQARKEAPKALQANDLSKAETLYRQILQAKGYVPKSWIQDAEIQLQVIEVKRSQAPPKPTVTVIETTGKEKAKPVAVPATQPARRSGAAAAEASVQTEPASQPAPTVKATAEREKTAPVRVAAESRVRRLPVAEPLTSQPTQPGVQRRIPPLAPQVKAPAAVAEPSLLAEITAAQQVQKEQTEATLRQFERQIREAVVENDFETAMSRLDNAHRTLKAARRLYTEAEYNRKQAELESLSRFVADEKKAFQQRKVAQQRKELEAQIRRRTAEVEEAKQQTIERLFNKAIQLRREKKYVEAIEVARQIRAIDPKFKRAQWFIEDLEDLASYQRQFDTGREVAKSNRQALTQANKARVSWMDDVRYPKNWDEISKSREALMKKYGRVAGESAHERTGKKLQQRIVTQAELGQLRNATLRDAINTLSTLGGVNIIARWNMLELVQIFPDDEVRYENFENLRDVTLRAVLKVFIESISLAEMPVNYAIDEMGLIIISSEDDLKTSNLTPEIGKLETRVYDLGDIMMQSADLTNAPDYAGYGGGGGVGGGGTRGGGGRGGRAGGTTSRTGGSRRGGVGGGIGGARGGRGGRGTTSGAGRGARGGVSGGYEAPLTPSEMAEDIIYMIQTLVDPDTWEEYGGEGTIETWRDTKLIITQTSEIHRKIEKLLDNLREPLQIQVAIEARFLEVRNNFLEEIGLDLDLILNSGNAGYDFANLNNNFGGIAPGGVQQLVPRPLTRLGIMPGLPAGPGRPLTQVLPAQPYSDVGLVPTGAGSNQWTPVPFLSGSNTLATPRNTGIPGNLATSVTEPAFQVFGAFLDDLQVNFLLEATQLDQFSSVVNAPRLLLQNGEQAWVSFGRDLAYVAELTPVVEEAAVGFETTTDFEFSGTILIVRAAVSPDRRYVTLYLSPSVTDVEFLEVAQQAVAASAVAAEGRLQLPQVTETAIETVVSVPDGGTLLIGGQKQSGEIEMEAGVPVLNKIPILKRAFSNKAVTKDDRTLLILVKPTILIPDELEAKALTGSTASY